MIDKILEALIMIMLATQTDTKADIDEAIAIEEETEPDLYYLGVYTCYGYCSCKKCCNKSDGITATGVKARSKHTVAVDPEIIPLGSMLVIDDKVYIAEDVGGSIKGCKIDIYFDSHDEALKFGKQDKEVFLVNNRRINYGL